MLLSRAENKTAKPDHQLNDDHIANHELAEQIAAIYPNLLQYLDSLNQIVLDKSQQIKLSVCALIAGGHVLFEDLPGLGKTTLAQALATLSGLHYQRIQFTNDLLPSDILGSNIFHPEKAQFEFNPGAIFSQILLADEINRSSPKTQSALLEAMEEGAVSIEGVRHVLPKPFWVLATQNPLQQSGTYPLPESQLDRFLMRLSMGYPSAEAERILLKGEDRRKLLAHIEPILTVHTVLQLQHLRAQVLISDQMIDYLQALAAWSRSKVVGLSTRGLLALKRAAQAYAIVEGRYYVIHEDVQAVFAAVIAHRIHLSEAEVQQALKHVPL
ncbi:MAG: AAA family ATPase [Acinetobacter populi]|jgi:MoxR-like ATPase|uniref:AAA family ATPase n=1 Tax=Acinetobacter populi TaxID=1582270 RepID=UPI002352ED30|nr:AAA family ATPase [Acinetobacter populi]MCH4247261.1 AAA family ATPase [Acinetobacter populi]